ncbi:MAG: prolipoprotein diacylglyceryl transferase [Clostridiales bacterium]|nr:prolipoprotein diacylglyceryl transferase [Clostridiales bacterium]
MSTVTFNGLGFSVNVKQIAFHIFGWPIHWYGIIIAVGFLLAVAYCSRKSDAYGISQDDLIDLLIAAVPLSIIGARIYYVVFYLDLYRNADSSLNFGKMIRIWDGGLAIYGGIIAAALTLLVFCKIRKIPFLAFADLGSQGMLIGQMVGRWGNFVNVEAYGAETTLPWRMGIYQLVDGNYQYLEVHPTFLYESLWNLLGFLLLSQVVAKRRKFDGEIFLGYIAWYGLGRSWIEGLRADSLYLFSTGIRVSQMLAVVTFVIAAGALVMMLRRSHRPEDMWVNRVAAWRSEEVSAVQMKGSDETTPENKEDEGERTEQALLKSDSKDGFDEHT